MLEPPERGTSLAAAITGEDDAATFASVFGPLGQDRIRENAEHLHIIGTFRRSHEMKDERWY